MTTETETNNNDSPRLYVGTYHKYNSGSTAGAWLNLNDYDDHWEFYGACAELHRDESNPEFMFQGFANFPRDLFSESGGIEKLYRYLDFIKVTHYMQHNDPLAKAITAAGMELGIPLGLINDAYQGQYYDDEVFACNIAIDSGSMDHNAMWPMNCIDWKRAARELMHDYSKVEDHYFANKW